LKAGYEDNRDAQAEEVLMFSNTIIDDLSPLAYDEESGYMGGLQGRLGPEILDGDLIDGVVDFSSNSEPDTDG